MLAAHGSRLGLIPTPAESDEHVLLVEGPPDMIAARSCGACAIAVPGDQAWQPSWARLLEGRNITIVMDCDPAGRAAAERIANDLDSLAAAAVVDLAPNRDDGYDLTNWLIDSGWAGASGEAGDALHAALVYRVEGGSGGAPC